MTEGSVGWIPNVYIFFYVRVGCFCCVLGVRYATRQKKLVIFLHEGEKEVEMGPLRPSTQKKGPNISSNNNLGGKGGGEGGGKETVGKWKDEVRLATFFSVVVVIQDEN